MKGIIFSELINWVEAGFSPQVADEMIGKSGVSNNGAYTSGGFYPHSEALALLTALSDITGTPVPDLARSYGRFLAVRLAAQYPEFMANHASLEAFLVDVGAHIHQEVSRLYPEARPPEVLATADQEGLHIRYASHRPLADVAHGLLDGFVEIYDRSKGVFRLDSQGDGKEAEFLVAAADR